ncbi:trypsin-like peptidase domain-containing protein [Streptomyces sp. NRRL F-5123]|uniref:VMAP-C domain-containing protein n=1 Tax=Streptomyces sp. NRRL F-5123 TaxID=1463856 RepID=UPI00131D5626|nr:trypsin-like peptidase domain-containing protein [Streptomyces sp. NRRL F-5123]
MNPRARPWLRTDPSEASTVWHSFASVLDTSSTSTSVAGAGVYVGDGLVLTCAHVVNDALGDEPFTPEPPRDALVSVAFPGLGEPRDSLTARVSAWIPAQHPAPEARPALPGDRVWTGDLALLRLQSAPPPLLRPVRWMPMAERQSVRAWHGNGEQFTFANGAVKLYDGPVSYIDGPLEGAAVGPGYSGGPLWCAEQDAVVGLVLGIIEPPPGGFASSHVVRRFLAVPWQSVRSFLPEIAPRSHPGRSPHRPRSAGYSPALHAFNRLVADVFRDPGRRAEQAPRLADELELDVDTDVLVGVDELAEILATVPRALAVLCEGLAVDRPDSASRLMSAGLAAGASGLLSVSERRWLLDVLPESAAARLEEAARSAMPHATLTSHLPPEYRNAPEEERLRQLVDVLEEFRSDGAAVVEGTPRVPAVLRAVEYLAALCGEPAAGGMREWSDAVAVRLGVARSALGERREDARVWALRESATAEPQPRLTVALEPVTATGYRCVIWYTSGRRDETAWQVLADDDTRTPEEITRLLHAILIRQGAVALPGKVPVVEFLLDSNDLDEPVDTWDNNAADGEDPVVLGAAYTVILRCPRLREDIGQRRSWQSRWENLDSGGLLHLTEEYTTSLQVYGALQADLNASRVILACAPRHRAALRAACMKYGIPVVLWDRGAIAAGRGDPLVALMLGGSARGLPHRVRTHRARALAQPRRDAPQPALVWDDATALPPTSRWSDPIEQEQIR